MAYIKQRGPKYVVCWREPSGKQRSKTTGVGASGKKLAQKLKEKIEAEMVLGTYGETKTVKWSDFAAEYTEKVIHGQNANTGQNNLITLGHFNRLISLQWVHQIGSRHVEEYIRLRQTEGVANSTINKELTNLRTMLRTAHRWGYLDRVPEIRFLRITKRIETFVSEDEFSAIYAACHVATRPDWPGTPPEDWWKAFLLFQFMTGWRVGQVLALRWDQLREGTILSRAEDNKGKRDVALPLHPILVEHMEQLRDSGQAKIFAFRGVTRNLDKQFCRIQREAGIKPANKPPGKWYTFHDLRRGFATVNADRLDTFELQRLMQHQSITTTQRYVAMAHRLTAAVNKVSVPTIDKRTVPAKGS